MSDVVCEVIAQLPTKYGTFEAHGYVDQRSGEHHVALVKGVTAKDMALYMMSKMTTSGAIASSCIAVVFSDSAVSAAFSLSALAAKMAS